MKWNPVLTLKWILLSKDGIGKPTKDVAEETENL